MRKIVAITIAMALTGAAFVGSDDVSAGGGCHHSGPTDDFSDEQTTTVDLGTCRFTPTVVRIDAGEEVVWTNTSSESHTVTGAAGTWGSEEKTLVRADSVAYKFAESGVFPYFCILHPGMIGAVVVGDGRAASSDVTNGGVKAVSAEAPGDPQSAANSEVAASAASGSGADEVLIAAIALLAALGGAAGALVIRRALVRG